MKIIKNPSYDELPKEEQLGKPFAGMGVLDVLLFAIFLIPMVIIPLLPLFAGVLKIIMNLIRK